MGRNISEEFGAVIDGSVAVAIEHEPGVIGIAAGPGESFSAADVVEVEADAVCCIRQTETVAGNIDHDWRVVRHAAAPFETPLSVFTEFRNQIAGWRWILLACVGKGIPEPTLRFAFWLVLWRIGNALAPRADGSRKPDTMIAGRAWRFGWLVRAFNRITTTIALDLHKRAARWRDRAIGGTGIRIVARARGEGWSWRRGWCG